MQCNDALKKFPYDSILRTIVGRILLDNAPDKAINHLTKALKRSPLHYPARLFRALAYLKTDNPTEALIDCLYALSTSPTNSIVDLMISISKKDKSLKDAVRRGLSSTVVDPAKLNSMLGQIDQEPKDHLPVPKISSIYGSDYNLRPVDRIAYAVTLNKQALIAIIESTRVPQN